MAEMHCQLRIALKIAARNFYRDALRSNLQIFSDSIGIRLKNALHLGKKFLVTIFSAIVYCKNTLDKMDFNRFLSLSTSFCCDVCMAAFAKKFR